MSTATEIQIRCGNHGTRKVLHGSVQDVKDCFAGRWDDDGVADAELATERALEDRGYEQARAQEDYERQHGVLGFIESWHLASPETCPCPAH